MEPYFEYEIEKRELPDGEWVHWDREWNKLNALKSYLDYMFNSHEDCEYRLREKMYILQSDSILMYEEKMKGEF